MVFQNFNGMCEIVSRISELTFSWSLLCSLGIIHLIGFNLCDLGLQLLVWLHIDQSVQFINPPDPMKASTLEQLQADNLSESIHGEGWSTGHHAPFSRGFLHITLPVKSMQDNFTDYFYTFAEAAEKKGKS